MATITYTPNGIARASGYYDPNNPYDTGRTGERNSELGGGKDTMEGWDYDAGRPRAGAVQRAGDGRWVMPGQGGGGGGGGDGTFLAGQALIGQQKAGALQAYKQALTRYNNELTSSLGKHGYLADIDAEKGTVGNLRVNQNAPYGTYQLLRRNNAMEYNQVRDAAQERGIGGRGLGAQGYADARFKWGAADTDLAQTIQSALTNRDTQQQTAWQEYQNLLWQLEMEALRMQSGSGDFGYGGGGDGGGEGEDDSGIPWDPARPKDWANSQRYVPKKAGPAGWGPVSSQVKNIIKSIPKVSVAPVKVSARQAPSKSLTPAKTKLLNQAIQRALQSGRF